MSKLGSLFVHLPMDNGNWLMGSKLSAVFFSFHGTLLKHYLQAWSGIN